MDYDIGNIKAMEWAKSLDSRHYQYYCSYCKDNNLQNFVAKENNHYMYKIDHSRNEKEGIRSVV